VPLVVEAKPGGLSRNDQRRARRRGGGDLGGHV
jgi:hypothetical protein